MMRAQIEVFPGQLGEIDIKEQAAAYDKARKEETWPIDKDFLMFFLREIAVPNFELGAEKSLISLAKGAFTVGLCYRILAGYYNESRSQREKALTLFPRFEMNALGVGWKAWEHYGYWLAKLEEKKREHKRVSKSKAALREKKNAKKQIVLEAYWRTDSIKDGISKSRAAKILAEKVSNQFSPRDVPSHSTIKRWLKEEGIFD